MLFTNFQCIAYSIVGRKMYSRVSKEKCIAVTEKKKCIAVSAENV